MSVVLEAVKFNHDSNSADHDALNIRKNETEFVNVPEWVQGTCVLPRDSLAAYAIKETKGKTITIQAKFRRADPAVRTIEVRAVDYEYRYGGCIYEILRRLGAKFLLRRVGAKFFLPPPAPNVLGEVKARHLTFPDSGETGFETFELEFVRLESVGVGIHTVSWLWQFRLSAADPWAAFATTHHRIYTVLEVPKSPWEQTPYAATNDHLPWTEVMDYACTWAIGSNDRDTTAAKVTERVNALGPSRIEYDCPGGGGSHYTLGNAFSCTQFLDRIAGGLGNGKYVNCTDCATIVSTFSNILGCDLWQSCMREKPDYWASNPFKCNEVIAIGGSTWDTPCGWAGFKYHEVAWRGGCDVNDEVFDACLKVDGDSDPTSSPHTLLLPVNMKFGTCDGPLQYRRRLATPASDGCPRCKPQPSTKQRRDVT